MLVEAVARLRRGRARRPPARGRRRTRAGRAGEAGRRPGHRGRGHVHRPGARTTRSSPSTGRSTCSACPRHDLPVTRLVPPLKPRRGDGAGPSRSSPPTCRRCARSSPRTGRPITTAGCSCPPATPTALADALSRLVDDPDLRQRLGGNAHDLGRPDPDLGGRRRDLPADLHRASKEKPHDRPAPSSNTDLVVLGLGYVGLPLAQEATRAGLTVRRPRRQRAPRSTGLNAGQLARRRPDRRRRRRDAGRRASGPTTDAVGARRRATTAVICVPTPLGAEGGPDLRRGRSARPSAVAEHLRPRHAGRARVHDLPGHDRRGRPPAARGAVRAGRRRGLPPGVLAGADRPGQRGRTASHNTPKVVGGLTPACTDAGRGVLRQVRRHRRRGRAAPARPRRPSCWRTPTGTSTSRWSTRWRGSATSSTSTCGTSSAARRTKPFGFQAFYPGPGVGGHCIPIDPNYLSPQRARPSSATRSGSWSWPQEINATMPAYVAHRAQNLLNAARQGRARRVGAAARRDLQARHRRPARVAGHPAGPAPRPRSART